MKGFSKSFEKQSANFVLIYGDNGDRTSIITPELIAEAVARAQSSHAYVELQCCSTARKKPLPTKPNSRNRFSEVGANADPPGVISDNNGSSRKHGAYVKLGN